eukprot:gene32096-40580_t
MERGTSLPALAEATHSAEFVRSSPATGEWDFEKCVVATRFSDEALRTIRVRRYLRLQLARDDPGFLGGDCGGAGEGSKRLSASGTPGGVAESRKLAVMLDARTREVTFLTAGDEKRKRNAQLSDATGPQERTNPVATGSGRQAYADTQAALTASDVNMSAPRFTGTVTEGGTTVGKDQEAGVCREPDHMIKAA